MPSSRSAGTFARIPCTNCTFGSVVTFPPSFVKTFSPSWPRVIESSPSNRKKRRSLRDATKRFQRLYSCSWTSRWRKTSAPATPDCRTASRTSCPRDRAVFDVLPRRFERAATSPVPLAPIHVPPARSEEHTSELQSHHELVCRLLLEKKKRKADR